MVTDVEDSASEAEENVVTKSIEEMTSRSEVDETGSENIGASDKYTGTVQIYCMCSYYNKAPVSSKPFI